MIPWYIFLILALVTYFAAIKVDNRYGKANLATKSKKINKAQYCWAAAFFLLIILLLGASTFLAFRTYLSG